MIIHKTIWHISIIKNSNLKLKKMPGFSKPSFIFHSFFSTIPHINSESSAPPPVSVLFASKVSETVSWQKLWCCYCSNILQHCVWRTDLICFWKVDHSRISINFSRNLLGLNNLCEVL